MAEPAVPEAGANAAAAPAVTGRDVHAPGVTRRAAVLGHPVAHSLSPVLHTAAYDRLGLAGWAYGLQDVTAAQLPALFAALDASWAGLSLTMPLKQPALPLLDVVDPLAEVTGSVNTVVVGPGGTTAGLNTDVHGIAAAVREVATPGFRPERAVILGAGATAASALAAVAELGCPSSTLVARRFGGHASAAAHRMGVEVREVTWSAAPAAVAEADLVVSTVPAGAADALAEFLGDADRAGAALLDVVYAPWPTPLAAAWVARGGAVAPGWLMLLHQAVDQVRLMTGRQPDVDHLRAALLAELARRDAGGAVPRAPLAFPQV